MKKIILLVALVISITACGGTKTTETQPNEVKQETVENITEEKTAKEPVSALGSTFKGNNGTYTIKEYEFMKGQYTESDIVAITIDYTNSTEENQNPWFAFATDFIGQQETESSIEELMGANGLYPDNYKSEAVKMSEIDVKPGATIVTVVGYELAQPESPVFLRDRGLAGGDGQNIEIIMKR